jgi:hypothetical protein
MSGGRDARANPAAQQVGLARGVRADRPHCTGADIMSRLHATVLTLLIALAGGFALDPAAAAADRPALEVPEGRVMLEITGAIAQGNGGVGAPVVARFDRAMLDALPQRETVTGTPWHEGPQRFVGPTIAALLQAVGAQGSRLRVIAVNDYSAELPMEDVLSLPVILASRQNGEPMSLRGKGPLFVIYPFDEVPGLLNETTLSRSVWQVRAIEVLP